MQELRSNLKYVGKATNEDALSLVLGGKGRFGRSVASSSAQKALSKAENEHITSVAKALGETEELLTSTSNESKQLKLIRQREILNILQQAGARKLHANELAAILAFKHGFGKELHEALKTLRRIEYGNTYVPFDGATTAIVAAVGTNSLDKVNSHLLKGKNVSTGTELKEIIPTGANTDTNIITSLGILDLMGIVRKLPRAEGHTLTYLHEEHALRPETRHLTIPRWNNCFRLLKELEKEGGSKELIAVYSAHMGKSIASTIANAKQVGLMEETKAPHVKGKPRKSRIISLTSKAHRLLGESKEELSEELRQLLLGEAKADTELSSLNQQTYNRVVEWLKIVKKLHETPRNSLYANQRALATELNITPSVLTSALVGRTPFGHKISIKRINTTYLSKLRREHPELADTLVHYLAVKGIGAGVRKLAGKD